MDVPVRHPKCRSRAEMQVHLKNAQGITVGVLSLADMDGGVRFIGWARNLALGEHSIHLYRGAICKKLAAKHQAGTKQDELYFGDFGPLADSSREPAEVAVTVPGVTVAQLAAGSGSTVVVKAKSEDSKQTLTCGIIAKD